MVEGFYGAVSGGGVDIEPWQIPKRGGSVGGSSRGIGQMAGGTGAGTTQGVASTGMAAGFAQGPWPGKLVSPWHRGFFGGEGVRTGGGA